MGKPVIPIEYRFLQSEIDNGDANSLSGVRIIIVDSNGVPTGKTYESGPSGQTPSETATAATVAAGSVVKNWEASKAYSVNDVVRATVAITASGIDIGDVIRRTVDGTSGSTFDTTEAAKWEVLGADLVRSVAGKTGTVTLVKADVGLNLVDNTADTSKPVSTAQQTALDGKAATTHTHNAATTSAAGFMSSTDKTKLDGVASGAETNVQADWNQATNTADDYIKNKPDLTLKEDKANKGAASGYAPLNAQSIVPSANVPSGTAQMLAALAGYTGYTAAFRIPFTAGSGGTAGYQVQLLIGESAGATGADFNINSKSVSFPSGEDIGGDFLFVRSDGTVVPFFVEKVTGTTPNQIAAVWLALPNGTAADTIFLLCGKAAASDLSTPAVFPFFDTFDGAAIDTAKWTADDSTGLTVANSLMRHTSNSARVHSVITFSANFILEAQWIGVTQNANGHVPLGVGAVGSLASNAAGYLWHPNTDFIRNDGTWVAQSATVGVSSTRENLIRMTVNGTSIQFQTLNYDTGANIFTASSFSNTISGEAIYLGNRYDSANTGQSMDISWRWVRSRQYATAPARGNVIQA